MPTQNRRDFIRLSGLGLLAYIAPRYAANPFFPADTHARLSVQLYTVRNELAKDFAGTLKRVAGIGFKYVETAFWPKDISLQDAAHHLEDAGLKVSSSHIEIPIGVNRKLMLDTARAFGTKTMIWHGWPEDKRYSSLEGTRELIGIYNEANKFAKDNGLNFGLHNHWWEYRNKVDGKFVYEILAAELDRDIFFEVDTYWVKVAGQDPAGIIEKLGERVKLLHIKDGPARWSEKLATDNPDPMTAVGRGTQNFPAIIKASKNYPDWLIIEMDKTATDVFEALAQSFEYMTSHKYVRTG
jgi:sugar phosphate isomerase/epimerase